MDTLTIVLLVIMAVLLVAYVSRRRARLKREED
jgi:hypothetical protein